MQVYSESSEKLWVYLAVAIGLSMSNSRALRQIVIVLDSEA